MNKYLLLSATVLTLLALACSCSSEEKKGLVINDKPSTMPSIGQGTFSSGNRVKDQLDKLKSDNAGIKKPSQQMPGDINDTIRDEDMSESGNNDKGPVKEEEPTPIELQPALTGNYSVKLSSDELAETKKTALSYAKKKFSKDIKSSDLHLASDGDELYKTFPFYNPGNIIIYTCKVNGKTKTIPVGRINADAKWEVLK